MAFTNANISFGGADRGTQSTSIEQRELFLKVFSGEVLTAYERAIKVAPLLTTRTISSGKSAQFPATGYAAARYFTQGESLLEPGGASGQSGDGSHDYLSTIKQSERVIFIDDLLVSSCFISELDEAMSHYDYRATFATELGRALARHQDKYAIQVIHDAATASGLSNDPIQTGTEVTNASAGGTASALLDSIYEAAQKMDEKDVPKEDRFVLVDPERYYLLLKAGVLTVPAMTDNGDTNGVSIQDSYSDARMLFSGGNDYPSASITMVAGMPVVVSNNANFGTTLMTDSLFGDSANEDAGSRNLSSTTNAGTSGSASSSANTVALVFHKGCAGVVRLKDVTMESEYVIERQGTLMVAKMATGMGRLRNSGAVRIRTS